MGIRALDIYKAESYKFRKLCMLMAGFGPGDVLENSACYVSFMIKSMKTANDYFKTLKVKVIKNGDEQVLEFRPFAAPRNNLEKKDLVSVPNVDAKALIHRSTYYSIYSAMIGNSKVILKVTNNTKYLTNNNNIENEFQVNQICSHPSLRKSISKINFENKPAIILEWFDGKTIEECGKFSIKDFLVI